MVSSEIIIFPSFELILLGILAFQELQGSGDSFELILLGILAFQDLQGSGD